MDITVAITRAPGITYTRPSLLRLAEEVESSVVAPMHMPIKQTVAFLLANKPAAAARILLAMTPDRVAVLAEAIEPAALTRILTGADPGQRADILSLLPPERRPNVLRYLTPVQAFELLGLVPPEMGWELLQLMPPRTAAELYAEIPAETRSLLGAMMPSDQPEDFFAALYERRAVDSVARSMVRVSRIGEDTGDLMAEVFGKQVQISVRYRPEKTPFTGGDVQGVATAALWSRIVALVIMTNAWIGESAVALARTFTASGRPVEIHQWTDDRGDGAFKRLLVRLAG